MIILGIDPGFDKAGYAIVEDKLGLHTLLASGCIKTDKAMAYEKRLIRLYNACKTLLKEHNPDFVAMESLFFATNAKTAMGVGQARGVILLACEQEGKKVVAYAPLQVKLAVTGYGKADKNQVKQMVKTLLHLSTRPFSDDTADAMAIALTHCFSYKLNSKVKDGKGENS